MVTFSRCSFTHSQILNTDKIVKKTAHNFQIPNKKLTELFGFFWILSIAWYGSFTKDHNVSETGSVSILTWMGLGHLRTETDPVSETLWSFVKLSHTRRWTESKRSQIVLYNIHHRQNPFKSTTKLTTCFDKTFNQPCWKRFCWRI
jgi:hypothetical protein